MTEAGWYPDPSDPGRLRLWDGANWSVETRPGGTGTPPPPGGDRPARWQLVVTAAAVVAFVVAGVAAVAANRDGDSIGTGAASGAPVNGNNNEPTEVIHLPAKDPSAGPFTESVGGGLNPPDSPPADLTSPTSGSTPELYAGTDEPAACDLEQLGVLLTSADAPLEAFADALGLPTADVLGWLDSLTPAVLVVDTWATHHTLGTDGADPALAVLEAGTEVAVDVNGLPRIRCISGSPLNSAPDSVDDPTRLTFTGEEWSGFDPASVVRVVSTDEPLSDFTFTDVVAGVAYVQPAGRRVTLSSTGVAGLPFGSTEAEVRPRLEALLGPPTAEERTSCSAAREPDEQIRLTWDGLIVRFTHDHLDAWGVQDPALPPFDAFFPPDAPPIPSLVHSTPVALGMTASDVEAGVNLELGRRVTGWFSRSSDTGTSFSILEGANTRFFQTASGQASSPPEFGRQANLRLTLAGPGPEDPVSGIILSGEFTPRQGEPRNACLGTDAPI